jgi:prepilin-type N-terminal cleavage/methylation domain-containing protein
LAKGSQGSNSDADSYNAPDEQTGSCRWVSWDNYFAEERTNMTNHIEVEETSSKKNKGFTLVELLIVIVILGILATVTVFAVRGITDKGKTSACTADQKTLQVALESYYANNGNTVIPTEAQLVAGGLIRTASQYLTIDAAGLVAVDATVASNPCTGVITAG